MNRIRCYEMGGKTGTTNSNADFWFMGYTPQLLAGTWVGCDDRFITIESSAYFGGSVARPIWEAFFKKVYADKTLGIERDAKFAKPAEMENELNSATLEELLENTEPGGDDEGVGNPQDYLPSNDYLGPESKPLPKDENVPKSPKQDSIDKKMINPDEKPIGAATDQPKKKGFLKRLFGKKEKKE